MTDDPQHEADYVERGAIALIAQHSSQPGDYAWTGAGEITRNRFREHARAVLEASGLMPPAARMRLGLQRISRAAGRRDATLREAAHFAQRVLDDAREHAHRGQPGNGITKGVRTDDDRLTAVQSKRGRPDEFGGEPGDTWAVAVVMRTGEDRYTPAAARELAIALLDAADECDQFAVEDIIEASDA